MKHADTVVIGLGSIGSMALWHLAQAGEGTVLGLEQHGRIHAAGAYTGESRLFRVAAKEGRGYTPALLHSRELWQRLEAASGYRLLLPVGALSIAPEGFPELEATLAAIHDYSLPHRIFTAAELREHYPQFAIDEGDLGVLDELGGGSRPEVAVLAASEQALAHGAEAWYDTEVTGIDLVGDDVEVATTRGPVRAGQVVIAAGPWTVRVAPQLADLVRVATFALSWFLPRHIERFSPDLLPAFMRDRDGIHAFGVPTLDGFSIKLCPRLELPEVTDYADRPTALSREQLRELGRAAQHLIPDLVPEPSRWSLHPDSITADHTPVIDTFEAGRIVVASGMSGNGFKFAPVYGQALAELALTGESSWRLPEFSLASHLERRAAQAGR